MGCKQLRAQEGWKSQALVIENSPVVWDEQGASAVDTESDRKRYRFAPDLGVGMVGDGNRVELLENFSALSCERQPKSLGVYPFTSRAVTLGVDAGGTTCFCSRRAWMDREIWIARTRSGVFVHGVRSVFSGGR